MILHVCSHYGDIELLPHAEDEDQCHIRYFKLTPGERHILNEFLMQHEIEIRVGNEGTIDVPMSLWQAGGIIGQKMHGGRKLLSAVRLTDGTVEVQEGTVWDWFRTRLQRVGLWPQESPGEPDAAVQARRPIRGCPMPSVTELRETRAAEVVRKFLNGRQREDFDLHRAFLALGCDTGHLYRVTSRWSPDVGRFGVLYDVDQRRRVCAHDSEVPPSEEVLAMKLSVEHFERAFLNQPHG